MYVSKLHTKHIHTNNIHNRLAAHCPTERYGNKERTKVARTTCEYALLLHRPRLPVSVIRHDDCIQPNILETGMAEARDDAWMRMTLKLAENADLIAPAALIKKRELNCKLLVGETGRGDDKHLRDIGGQGGYRANLHAFREQVVELRCCDLERVGEANSLVEECTDAVTVCRLLVRVFSRLSPPILFPLIVALLPLHIVACLFILTILFLLFLLLTVSASTRHRCLWLDGAIDKQLVVPQWQLSR